MNSTNDITLTIPIDPEFRPYLPSAIARFQYLYPALEVTLGDDIVISRVGNGGEALIRRDFRYALYRERIQAESADMRSALLGALLK